MGTTADKLSLLLQTKNNIKNAIIEKGQDVSDNTPFSDYPDKILAIESGGAKFSISIANPPNKTSYYVGDSFDTTGLVVNGLFENGLSFNIPLNYVSIFPSDQLSLEINSIIISFEGQSVQQHISVTEKPPVEVFGVMWNYANSSTALTRLTSSNDPYSYVTNSPSSSPVPAVGTGSGSSPFDNYMPWAGMEEYNINGTTIGAKRGETGFSRTSYDTMVYIPEFWYKVVDDSSGSKRYFYVSGKELSGFKKHPGSGKYVSRYTANSSYKSVSGNQSVVSITRETGRTSARNKGTGWQLYDFASWCAIVLLYLVEYADWNSQAVIGRGYVDENSAQINTGATDSMVYHTGRAAGTDGKTAIQYRHIENLWGNLYQFIDGINFNDRKAYVCLDPTKYADDTATNYIDTGITLPSSNNYIKGLGYSSNNDWLIIPNDSGGTDSTYIPDYVYSNTGWRVLRCGGFWYDTSAAGAACFDGGNSSTVAGAGIGVRLLYNP